MTCEKCKSICIVPISEHPSESKCIDETKHIDSILQELVRCTKCGAVCQEMQFWNFDGDPAKIDKRLSAKEGKAKMR